METYADDAVVNTVGKILGMTAYILTAGDATREHYGVAPEIHKFFLYLRKRFENEVNPSFAIARMNQPMRIVRVSEKIFTILVSERTIYDLFKLSSRLQSLSPIAQFLGLQEKLCCEDYSSKSLIDISRLWVESDIECEVIDYTCAISALLFMVSHEYAHFAHGHVDFLKSQEFSKFKTSEAEIQKTNRALEMDADASATTTIQDYFSSVVVRDLIKNTDGSADPLRVALFYYRRYLLGVYTTLIYSDVITDNYLPKTHMFGYARYINITKIIEIVLRQQKQECIGITEVLRQKIADGFTVLSGSLYDVGHPIAANCMTVDGGEMSVTYSEIGVAIAQAAIDETLERWAEILPDLRKYLRAGKLAPARASMEIHQRHPPRATSNSL